MKNFKDKEIKSELLNIKAIIEKYNSNDLKPLVSKQIGKRLKFINQDITLIIPVYNDQDYIRRSVEYYKDFPIKIVYCDSSKKKYDGFFYKNMEYVYLKEYTFPKKILYVLNKVKTRYVTMCALDDFILKKSLCLNIKFLRANKKYKMILGNYLGFYESNKISFFKIYNHESFDYNFLPKLNAEKFFSNYFMDLWGIYERKTLIKAYKIIENCKLKNHNFYEIVIGAVFCVEGGIKKDRMIIGVRQVSKKSWGRKHEPLTNIDKSNSIKGDFKKMESNIDSISFKGYSKFVMKNYLKYSNKLSKKRILIGIIDSIFLIIRNIFRKISSRLNKENLISKKN